MAKKHLLDTVRYTSIGLFRMGRESVHTLFEKAYEAGRGKSVDKGVDASAPAEVKAEGPAEE
ncbi:MAG: hypothetical protein IJW83_02790 [Clostridia bacterium]|nr:hypothetical protein [Clostridia bacterium]